MKCDWCDRDATRLGVTDYAYDLGCNVHIASVDTHKYVSVSPLPDGLRDLDDLERWLHEG